LLPSQRPFVENNVGAARACRKSRAHHEGEIVFEAGKNGQDLRDWISEILFDPVNPV
jgi:hypothetical protein